MDLTRPRWPDEATVTEHPEGAWVHSPHGSLLLRRPGAHVWLSRLAPFLTGEHTVHELVEALPAPAVAQVRWLVGELTRAGILHGPAPRRDGEEVPAQDRTRYPQHMAFLEYAGGAAAHRWQALRRCRWLLVGDGPVLPEVLRLGLQDGWRHVHVAARGPKAATRLRALAEAATAGGDTEQLVRVSDSERQQPPLADADMVVQITSAHQAQEADPIEHACAELGVPLAQVVLDEQEAWIGPVAEPRTGAAALRRRLVRDATSSAGPAPARCAATAVAAQAVRAATAFVTGLEQQCPAPGPASPRHAVRVDLSQLTSSHHRVAPPPRTPTPPTEREDHAAQTLHAWAATPPLPPQEMWERITPLIDPRTGVLREVDAGDWAQHPLWTCAATAGRPLPDQPGRWQTSGHGDTWELARDRAALAAVAGYAAYVETTAVPSHGAPSTGRAQLWGLDLLDDRPRRVPVSSLWPEPATVKGSTRAVFPPVGTAAAASWSQAVSAGLRARAQQVLTSRLRSAPAPLPAVDLRQPGRHSALHDLLQATGTHMTCYDLTGVLEIPGYMVRTGNRTVALCCAARPEQALTDCLELALLAWQAQHYNEPGYHPHAGEEARTPRPGGAVAQPEDHTPGHAAGNTPSSPKPPPLHDEEPQDDIGALAKRLDAHGLRAVAVPLHADPALAAAVPHLVHIALLTEGELNR